MASPVLFAVGCRKIVKCKKGNYVTKVLIGMILLYEYLDMNIEL